MPPTNKTKQGRNTSKTGKKQATGRSATGQFVSGQSGNPNGRPLKGYSITDTVRDMLGSKPKTKQKLAKMILEKAEEGDLVAFKMLWQYVDGMPTQNIKGDMDVTHNAPLTDEQLDRILHK